MPPKGKRKQPIDEDDAESNEAYDSDDIDDDSAVEVLKARKSKARLAKNARPPAKKRRRANDDLGGVALKDGQQVVGVVVQAPKTGLVPPGQISQNTLDFLGRLSEPECNNRTW